MTFLKTRFVIAGNLSTRYVATKAIGRKIMTMLFYEIVTFSYNLEKIVLMAGNILL